jgi:hypothetical protein
MTKEIAQKLVEKFNKQFPIGYKVRHRKTTKSTFDYVTVKSKAFVSTSAEPVVFFHELSGYYSIDPLFVDYDENVSDDMVVAFGYGIQSIKQALNETN